MALIKEMTPVEIERNGFDALCSRLGPAGAIRYLQQAGLGRGDYTAERAAILRGVSLDEIAEEAQEIEKTWPRGKKRPSRRKKR